MKQRRKSLQQAVLAVLVVLAMTGVSPLGGGARPAFAEGSSVGTQGDFSAATDGKSAVASTDVGILVESDLAVSVLPERVCGLPDDVAHAVLEAQVTGAVEPTSIHWTRTVGERDGGERDDATFSATGASHRLADDMLTRGEVYYYRATVEDGAGAQMTSAAVVVSQDYRAFHNNEALADNASGTKVEGSFYDDGHERAVLSVRPVDGTESSGGLADVYGALAEKAAELGGSIGCAYDVSLLLPTSAPADVPAYVGSVRVSLPAKDGIASRARAASIRAAADGASVRVVRWNATAGVAVEVPGGAQLTPGGVQAVFAVDELGMFAVVQEVPTPGTTHEVSVSASTGGAILYQGKEVSGSVEVPHASDVRFQVVAQAGFVIDELLIDGSPVDGATGFASWEAQFANVVDDSRSIGVTFRSVDPVPAKEFTLVTMAGAHGAVDPDTGPDGMRVKAGSVQTIRFLPEAGYRVGSVTVTQDGTSTAVSALGDAYTFTVVADVRVQVEFEEGGGGSARVHQISALAGEHGSVSPTSAIVQHGGEATFSFIPDDGYRVSTVLVDGVVVETAAFYTFRSVVADHQLEVQFEPNESAGSSTGTTYVVQASAGFGGRVSPEGSVRVMEGASATFAFIPEAGYAVSHVVVDGCDVGYAPRSWTFDDVRANHTVQVSFAPLRAIGLAPTGDTVVPLVLVGVAFAVAAVVLIAPLRRRVPQHAAGHVKGQHRGTR